MREPAAAVLAAAFLLLWQCAAAEPEKLDDHHWAGVERIVAIGDLHGDYEQYMAVLEDAGLVDRRGRWTGGETHLVQTGDIADRGPDSRKIIDHLEELKEDAKRDGGRVHTLIGNHEAMNVYGDLRYVHPGEYEAFRSRHSKRLRELQWEHHLSTLQERDPEAFAELDLETFREQWEAKYPLGWVEHRQAWVPEGDYGELVLENPVVLKINDTLFLHGGLSAKYCEMSLEELNEAVHQQLDDFNYRDPGILEDEYGPLWYRGLATEAESKREQMVSAILERYGAKRMVVGHTPTQGVVWPRFDGRVILNDPGIAEYYGGHEAFLEIKGDKLIAHYGEHQVEVPADNQERIDYLNQVIKVTPANAHLRSRLERMMLARNNPPSPVEEEVQESGDRQEPLTEEEVAAAAEAARIEAWLSPDNCR